MKDARKVTLATAKSAGKTACPVCMKTTATTNYYATVGGKHYHSKSTCSGMKNATRVTLATAQKRNQTPCPVCLQAQAKTSAEAKTYVYATTAGKYYHSKSGCSGMKNARRVTLASAKNNGKTACPVCMKAQASTSVTYVYSTLSGKYYHKRTCSSSDAKNTKKVALATAKKYGKTPCPTCFKNQTIHVYVTPAGLKYHDKVTCEGVRNTMKITLKTALERKYVRCTVCDAPKA
jgi:cytidine deaminase